MKGERGRGKYFIHRLIQISLQISGSSNPNSPIRNPYSPFPKFPLPSPSSSSRGEQTRDLKSEI